MYDNEDRLNTEEQQSYNQGSPQFANDVARIYRNSRNKNELDNSSVKNNDVKAQEKSDAPYKQDAKADGIDLSNTERKITSNTGNSSNSSVPEKKGNKPIQNPINEWMKKISGKNQATKKALSYEGGKTVAKFIFSKYGFIVLGAVIFLFICLFIVYYIYAMPSSLSKTISYKSNIQQMESSGELTLMGIQAIGDFIFSLNPFDDSSTSDESLENANVKVPLDGEDYDADNDFDAVLIEEYKLLSVALSKAYDQALENIEEKANAMGYDGTKTIEVINNTYTNGWKDVYKDVNYATLIAIFCFQMQENTPAWSSSRTEFSEFLNDYKNGSINSSYLDNQLKELKEIILDEDNAEYFYHANFEVVFSENSDKPYLKIELLPFCLLDLYELIEIDPDEQYDDMNTYAEMQSIIVSILKVCGEDAMGRQKPIYKTLGMENADYSWNYVMGINDISNLYAYQPVEEKDNALIMYSLLRMMGYNEVASSGICGNLEAEHEFSTSMEGDSGSVGIAQWKGGRKDNLIKYAEEMGLPVTNIYVQGLFLIHEMESNPSYYHVEDLKNAASVQEATDIFCIYFERPNNYASKKEWAESPFGNPANKTYFAWERFNYSSVSGRYHIDLNKRRGFAESIYTAYKLYPILNWPVPDSSEISNEYKNVENSAHYGIDISASKGTRVYAAAVGTVTEVGNSETKGNYVAVSHFEKYTTEYYHLESVAVKEGDFVTLDTALGTVGDTGNAKEPHLHFGVKNEAAEYIEPLTVVNPNITYNSNSGIVSAAESLVGKIVYEWGSKPTNAGWNNRWNNGKTGLDCSGFVQWVYWTATGTKQDGLGSTYAICKTQTKIAYNDLKPGDLGLIFDGGTYYLDATGERFASAKDAQASNKKKGFSLSNVTTVSNHVGIYAGKDEEGKDIWIHCTGGSKDTVVKENYTRFKFFYRVEQ